MQFLLLAVGAILGLWIVGLAATTDLTVPRANVRSFSNVLAVFPHADDETVNCGGTIRRFASSGARVTLVLLTSGERGNAAGTVDPELKAVRRLEASRVAGILGASTLIQQDFGDGMLGANKHETATYLAEMIQALGPDLILTYDAAGLDGHPDHVVCSEIVMQLRRTQFSTTTLWCVALPRKVTRILEIAGQLRVHPDIAGRRASPTVKVFIGAAALPKIRAWYAYRSQRGFIAKGMGRFVPLWFAVSAMQFEYFAEAV